MLDVRDINGIGVRAINVIKVKILRHLCKGFNCIVNNIFIPRHWPECITCYYVSLLLTSKSRTAKAMLSCFGVVFSVLGCLQGIKLDYCNTLGGLASMFGKVCHPYSCI